MTVVERGHVHLERGFQKCTIKWWSVFMTFPATVAPYPVKATSGMMDSRKLFEDTAHHGREGKAIGA